MEEKWYCNECGEEFAEPLRRFDYDDGAVATATDLCPHCGAIEVERMEKCPTCPGWMKYGEKVCIKCQLRLKGDLSRFARQYLPASLAALDDLLEGNGLEMFT